MVVKYFQISDFTYKQRSYNIISIPVIASFDTNGKIIPLYFRYKDYGAIPVNLISQNKYISHICFVCKCEIEDQSYQIQLMYYWNEMKWYLNKPQ